MSPILTKIFRNVNIPIFLCCHGEIIFETGLEIGYPSCKKGEPGEFFMADVKRSYVLHSWLEESPLEDFQVRLINAL